MWCYLRFGIIFVVALTVTSCATADPVTQRIPVTSHPEGAEVVVGSFRGVTPTIIEVSRAENSHTVRVSKVGYKTEIIKLKRIITPSESGKNPLGAIGKYQTIGGGAGGAADNPMAMTRGMGIGAVFGVAVLEAELKSGAHYRFYPILIELQLEPGDPSEVNNSALREMDRLKAQGVISEEEYRLLRERAAQETK